MNNLSNDWTPATVQTSHKQPAGSETQIDLGELFGLLWYRKWIIGLVAAIMTILSIVYVQNATPLYEAKTTLILDAEEQNVTGLDGLVGGLSDEDAELNSQIEVIRSRKIVGQVVDKLTLDQDEEFVKDLRERSWLNANVMYLKRTFISALSPANKNPGAAPKQPNRELAIDDLIGKLNVSVISNTYVFQIKLETTSPEKSALIVNTLATSFIEDQVSGRLESTSQAAGWLDDKVTELGEKLAIAEAASAEYRSNTERNVTEADVAASNVNLKNARGRLSSFETNLAAATGSTQPRTDRDLSRYALLKDDILQLENIVAKQTADLLALRQLDREAAAAGTIYQHFATRLNEIEVQKGLQEADVQKLSAAIPRYQPTKPKKVLTVAFAGLLGLLLGAAYVITRRLMDRSFSDPSELQQRFGIPVVGTIPKAPSKGRRDLLTYAMERPASALMEAIRDMRTSLSLSGSGSTDVEAHQGTVLLMTSSVPGEGKTTSSILLAVNSAALNKKVLLIECDLRRSTFQSYFGRPADPARVKPEDMHKYPPSLGLVDAIYRTPGWESAIWTEPKTQADIVFGGKSASLVGESKLRKRSKKKSLLPWKRRREADTKSSVRDRNAADIFASDDFSRFIDLMRANYDLVILDCPPVLPVPDARLIAKTCDAVVYIVRSGTTPESVVAAGLRLFDNIGVKVNGLNLTQMQKGARGYGYYGYGYGAYGGYQQNKSGYYEN